MNDLEKKQREFNEAMERFEKNPIYRWTGRTVSFINVTFQIGLLVFALQTRVRISHLAGVLVLAYVLADFVNGFVHLLLDNRSNYGSFTGPFVAAFHLHHRTPTYKRRNIFFVYIHEAGSKVWLAFYFIIFALAVRFLQIPPLLVYGPVFFGIFSCLAEVSHYCCHIANPPVPRLFTKLGLFMSKKHHARHHTKDNCQYAFLNAVTDPVLNGIAKVFYKGYKNNTDLHYAAYAGTDTENRT